MNDVAGNICRVLLLGHSDAILAMVGRRRLTVSKPVLEAPMVPALDTIIRRSAFKLCFRIQLAPLNHGRARPGQRCRCEQSGTGQEAGAYTRSHFRST